MVLTRKDLAYWTAGGTASALLVWLCWADSAEQARRFLQATVRDVGQKLGRIQTSVSAIQRRIEEFDRLTRELLELAKEERPKVEAVIRDVSELLKEIKDGLEKVNISKSPEAAAKMGEMTFGG
jgi:hypothetical protein